MKYVLLILVVLFSCSKKKQDQSNLNKSIPVFKDSLFVGSKTPYQPNKTYYVAPPDSLSPFFVAMVARHGSRYMSGPDEDIALLNLLKISNKLNVLTHKGIALLNDINSLTKIQKNNYGEINACGRNEHYDLGKNLASKTNSIFDSEYHIIANATYKSRTQESRAFFLEGMKKQLNKNLAVKNENFKKGSDSILRFHKTNVEYQNYLSKHPFKIQLDSIKYTIQFKNMVLKLVNDLFIEDEQVRIINSKNLEIRNGEDEITINNANDIVISLYECYKIVASLKAENAPSLHSIFTKEDLQLLAFISQIESFYEKGIGFPGENITYEIARPLLNEMINKTNMAISNEMQGAFLNFAHAETVAPFAVLTGLQHLKPQNKLVQDYYPDFEFIKMASNVQWLIFKSKKDNYFIKVLYNEKEMKISKLKSYNGFYNWDDFKALFI